MQRHCRSRLPARLAAVGALSAFLASATLHPVRAGQADNVLVVGSTVDPQTLDPAVGLLGTDIPYLYPLYDRLIDFEPATLEPRPGLATSWKWSDDRKVLELRLREGVTFQDGTPMDAEAVRTSLQYFKDARRNLDLDTVTSIEVRGPYTLALHLDRPNSTLIGLLAERAGMVISPAAIAKWGVKEVGQHPVGAGPFMLKSLEPGKAVQLVRYPGYWKGDEPRLAGIEFRIIRNATSLVTALQSGQLDYVAALDPVNLPVLQRNARLRVAVEPSIAFGIINMRTGQKPLDDKRVRRAVALSIDRQVLANAAFGGGVKGGPAVMPAPPQYWPASKALENALTYQPDEAKRLLAEAGYPDGIDFEVCVVGTLGSPLPTAKLADIMREEMRPAGIRLKTTQVASNPACNDLFQQGKSSTFTATWSGRPDPALTYAQVLGSHTAFNIDGTKFDDADDVIARLISAPDRDAQKKEFDRLNHIWVENIPMIPLYYYVNVVAYNARLSGEQPNLLGRPYVSVLRFDK